MSTAKDADIHITSRDDPESPAVALGCKKLAATVPGQDNEPAVGGMIGTGGKGQQQIPVPGCQARFVESTPFDTSDIIIELLPVPGIDKIVAVEFQSVIIGFGAQDSDNIIAW